MGRGDDSSAACGSIKLIGKFPGVLTPGHPAPPGTVPPDFTVRAMIITADATTGQPCLIGVQTAENGPVGPLPHSTTLPLG